jgi:cysteine desulfurase/selenocysteine lyase
MISTEAGASPTGGTVAADQLASILSDSFGVMVRSGLQCAHPLFAELGATEGGAVRVSAYIYNDERDVTKFGESMDLLLRKFSR